MAGSKIDFLSPGITFFYQKDPEAALTVAFYFGISLQTIYFPLRFELEKIKRRKTEDSIQQHISLLASYYRFALNKRLKCEDQFDQISFRFFVKDNTAPIWFLKLFKRNISYRLLKVDSLVKTKIATELKFIVYPLESSQGLVGKCYIEEAFNVKNGNMNDDEEYMAYNGRMTSQQINASRSHKFVATYPISKNEKIIECIAAIDSKNEIEIMKELDQEKVVMVYEIMDDFYQNIKLVLKKMR